MDTTCTDCNQLVPHCQCGLFKRKETVVDEPIAWMVTNIDGQDAYVTADPTLAQRGQRALPLYTAPVIDTCAADLKAAVSAERERCAKVCEAAWEIDGSQTAAEFAARVRGA